MYHTVEAIVEPAGTVRLLEALEVDHPCRAFVTLLENPRTKLDSHPSTYAASDILKFLAQTPLSTANKLTAEQIEAQINSERQSWD